MKSSISCLKELTVKSPPSRWCGLKSHIQTNRIAMITVTTFAVVWIEIPSGFASHQISWVTTFAVVWIEIGRNKSHKRRIVSPPSRWCGLKSVIDTIGIEVSASPPSRWCGLKYFQTPFCPQRLGHHLRGGVD